MYSILSHNTIGRYSATVIQSININTSLCAVWKEISNFIGLPEWAVGVRKTEFLSKTKCGRGVARDITFEDDSHVIEYAVGWINKQSISYVATKGLPLDGYHATLSILQKDKIQLKWISFLISNNSNKKQFEDFLTHIESFYVKSLKKLKVKLEKAS